MEESEKADKLIMYLCVIISNDVVTIEEITYKEVCLEVITLIPEFCLFGMSWN